VSGTTFIIRNSISVDLFFAEAITKKWLFVTSVTSRTIRDMAIAWYSKQAVSLSPGLK
jgi:hypothetical protein